MTKFIIASRSRKDINLPYYFGRHKFAVIPRSMFMHDGSLILGADKSIVMHQIE